jgi:hypothetical protein
MGVFGVIVFILILVTIAAMFTTSYLMVVNQREEWTGGLFLIKTSQTLVYHTAFVEIVQYYN